MYEHTVTAKNKEDTVPVETLYERTVDSFKSPVWFTISPDPHKYGSYKKGHEDWISEIRRIMYNTCNDYIYVLELAGLRPHYHGVADVKDHIGFTKRMFNASRYDNVKIHRKFKEGLGYMFKDIENTYKLTGIVPIRERQDDSAYKQAQKQQKLITVQHQIENNIEYPEWMNNIE